jgi:hypothetical protein
LLPVANDAGGGKSCKPKFLPVAPIKLQHLFKSLLFYVKVHEQFSRVHSLGG